jgi:uncharacterized Zn finger protein
MIERGIFRKTVSILVIISQVGCSNVKTIDVPPEALHERIRQGDLIKVSDSVRIVTVDEKEYRFVVTGITTDEIHGKVVKVSTEADEIREEAVTIPIDSVVAVKTQELSVGKTALLAGGVIGIMALIFIATAPAAILSAGGG